MQHPFENIPLLLVSGQGRSGTTVLTKAVAEHPSVYSNRVESNVLKDVLLAGRASSTMSSRVRQMVLSREQHDLVFRNMLLQLLFPRELWSGDDSPEMLSTFSAMNPEAAEFAVSVFPNIRFANIVRHGVEVVASRMAHRSLGNHSFEEQCVAWAVATEMAEWGDSRSEFDLVRHEQLLEPSDCAGMFDRLLASAGLPATDACAKYVMENRFNQTSYDNAPEQEQEDLSGRRQRWNHWSKEQKTTFTKICGPAMEYFDYEIPQ